MRTFVINFSKNLRSILTDCLNLQSVPPGSTPAEPTPPESSSTATEPAKPPSPQPCSSTSIPDLPTPEESQSTSAEPEYLPDVGREEEIEAVNNAEEHVLVELPNEPTL